MVTLAPVIVTATQTEETVFETPYTAHVVSSKRFLDERSVRTLVDALSETPGVLVQRTGYAQASPFLRGFTGYSESAPPDHVMQVLQAYHEVAGPLIEQQHGTLERFLGDGIMVLFNAPLATPEPCLRAVRMAVALRDQFHPAVEFWQLTNNPLGIGIGIAHGTATVGTIGFEGRLDYSAIGPVCNLAARLCDHAAPSEILISSQVNQMIAGSVDTEPLAGLNLKGISGIVQAHSVVGI